MVVAGPPDEVVFELGVIAVTAALFAFLARRARQPTIVGFLLGGVVVGPLLNLVEGGPALAALAEFGIALLLFLVGIDLSVKELRTVGLPALTAALAQLSFSALGGYALARLLGFDSSSALFLAAALAFSSTVVVVKILVDLDEISHTHGRLAVGVLLVQDVVVVLLLTILPVVGGDGGEGGDPVALLGQGALALGRMLLLAGGAVLASRTVLPLMFSLAADRPALLLLVGLVWLFAAVAVSALLHVSPEVGAFAAGLSLAPLPYASELRRRVRPLLDLFLALFFVTLGAGLELGPALALLPAAVAFSLFVLIGKPIVLTGTFLALHYPRKTSFRTGLTMGQVSEFSIVLAALGIAQGLIDERAQSFIVLVAMVTIAASGGLISSSGPIHDRLSRLRWFRALPEGDRDVESFGEPPHDHVLIIGWDALARRFSHELATRGERVVVLEARPNLSEELPAGVEPLYGDPDDPDAIAAASIGGAKAIVVNGRHADVVRAVLERTDDKVPVLARVDHTDAMETLADTRAILVTPARLVADAVVAELEEVRRDG